MKETVQELQEGQTGKGPLPIQKVINKNNQKKAMGYIEEEIKEDFICSVEYQDSRQRKIRGDFRFEGKIVYDSTKADTRTKEEYELIERVERERDNEIALLNELIERFDISLLKKKIESRIEKTMDSIEMDKAMTQE